MLWLIFFDAVKRKRFIIIRSLFLISPSPQTARVPSGHSSHIYNLGFCVCHGKNCHGDEGCPRADCINGVNSVVTMVCVMYDMYSDQ